MDVSFLDIATLLLTLATPIVGYFVKQQKEELREQRKELVDQREEIDDLRESLNAHKLYASENFTRKLELKEMRAEIMDAFRRLENKLDGARKALHVEE